MVLNTSELADWSGRMSAAIAAKELAEPAGLEAATLAVNVLAIEFKVSNYHLPFALSAWNNTQPYVVSTFPTSTATGVALNTSITVTFSEAMDVSTMIASNFLLSKDGGAYAAVDDVDMDVTNTIATLTVSGGLDADTRYRIRVLTDAHDAGTDSPLTYQFDFPNSGFLTVA